MDYQTFEPCSDLKSLVKCYWTLEVPAHNEVEKQRIVPDGCIELAFILGDDIKRYTSDDNVIIQPRAMVLGQISEPFYIKPTGKVNSFAVRFYPYGFASFVTTPIRDLANKETPIDALFGKQASKELSQNIVKAKNTESRIEIIEAFLLNRLIYKDTIDSIVRSTIDAILSTKGSKPINTIIENDMSKRRQLERKFSKQIGISPKQLGKVIRMQAALKMMLNKETESLTQIAYSSKYFDQAHFIKDFKEFTGTNPNDFLKNNKLLLSSLFYAEE